ncbi:MAG: hypothetical protein V7629_11625 [Motiliproteus sp.]
MVRIFSNSFAFAALRADGSVVTWGHSTKGGNSSAVSHLLTDTRPIPDADGLSNAAEWAGCVTPYASDAANLGRHPCLSAGNRDTDGDGVWDNNELFYATEPRENRYQDSMGDLDLNGMPDFWIQPSL